MAIEDDRKKEKEEAGGSLLEKLISSPPRLILGSFLVAICIGWVLLMMPFSVSDKPLSPIDALFTITSGVCVTGLTVISVEQDLSFWGQLILLIFIQLGGLGIMTFSTFFLFLLRRTKLSFTSREALQQSLTAGWAPNLYALLFAIFKMTLVIEIIGAAVLFLSWRSTGNPTSRVVWDAIFHSVSSFCNAGFSTFTENLYRYRTNLGGVFCVATLIVLGGLGFFVLQEVYFYSSRGLVRKPTRHLSLQTRMVLLTSLVLIVLGAVFFLVLDSGSSMKHEPAPGLIVHSLFQSITARTAGFNTLEISKASNLGLLLLIVLMFIGGSPGSTAGGIKTTTAAIIFMTIVSHIRNRRDVEILHRRVPTQGVRRAFVIFIVSLLVITIFFGMIALVDKPLLVKETPQDPAMQILFETVSAFGTVGLSTGITPFFTAPGKLLIIILMLIGRLGPLTIAVALIEQRETMLYRYPKEDVMVG